MGVHFTDLIRYQLGNIEEVYGDVRLIEPVRKKQESIGSTSDQTRRKKTAQMKKNPEIISQVVRFWLNQK